MSCFGSTRTVFSTSNMSLASSTLMTAPSTLTISDADYETSDEQMLSPQILDKVDAAQISQSSSNLRWSANLLASQSVSCLVDADDDFAISSDAAEKYLMAVKSDTCLNQQSKIISDFINDMRLQEPEDEDSPELSSKDSSTSVQTKFEDADSAELSGKDSSTSVQTKFFPATNASNSPYGSIVDINIADPADERITDEDHSDAESEKARGPVRLTLSETRHKIIENLAQVTSDKLFSKAAALRYNFDPASSTTNSEQQRSQVEPASVRRVTSRRSPFQRCRGVESLLQIDYELQPLNLMLSRLLAEFRAMDLRGKLGHQVDADESDSKLPVMTRASMEDWRRKEEPDTCVKFLSHERLAGKEATTGIAAQISRSCEDNCLAGRLLARGSSSPRRTEPSEKHPERSNETERNPRCHRGSGEARCTAADDRLSQKVRGCEEEDFGSGVIRLMEIASTN